MQIGFHGASGEVTGSCYRITTPQCPGGVLVDFGMHQGGPHAEAKNHRPPAFEVGDLESVVLTHGHLDHCGRLPLLVRAGYAGSIHCTPATRDLAAVILEDSAGIQEEDAQRQGRKRQRAGRPNVAPLYTRKDVAATIAKFVPLPFGEKRQIAPGIEIRLHEAGHILGSAWVEMRAGGRTVVFSGDIGPHGLPLLPDAANPESISPDALLLESTYGDRDHRSLEATLEELAGIIGEAAAAGGRVIIPAFAVGRTQDVVYHLGKLMDAERVPRIPIVVDSPMALEATNLYRRHAALFDEELNLSASLVRFVRTPQESIQLNSIPGPMVLIASSGMATGGRVLHHLRHSLWRPETRVVFVGFQAEGTLGRKLVRGERMVRIYGESILVRAHMHTLNGFSAHAGQTELVEWAAHALRSATRTNGPTRVFLVHGEDGPRAALKDAIQRKTGVIAELPRAGDEMAFA